MSMKKSDMRGLNEKGKKDYPKFTREQIELKDCEACHGFHTVKKYQIIKKSGNTDEIYLCESCAKIVPEGVTLVPLESIENSMMSESSLKKDWDEDDEVKPEIYEKEGDTLLV